MIHCCTPSVPSLCVAHSVPRKADGVFAFGPRRPLGGAPPGGGGLRGAFFALLDASLHFASIAYHGG